MGGQAGQQQVGSTTLIELLTAKAAKDLSLDLAVPAVQGK